MHALIVEVDLSGVDREQAMKNLNGRIVPHARELPGFLSGVWMDSDDAERGMSVMLFDSEEHARTADLPQVGEHPMPGVTIMRRELRGVAAAAVNAAAGAAV